MKARAWILGWGLLAASVAPVRAADWFVATNGSDAAAGTSWATAKLTIQAGVDAAEAGGVVWVSNGVYGTGGRTVVGPTLTRVVVAEPILLRSVNGPEATLIDGLGRDRCAYLTNGATLAGFTLTNGHAMGETYPLDDPGTYGGGAYCESGAMATNCIFVNNYAPNYGGAVYGGFLVDCMLAGNWAGWGGGGASHARLSRCLCSSNQAGMEGGGVMLCTLSLCTLSGNHSLANGGGAERCVLDDCLIAGNIANDRGGGVSGGTLNNCIVQGNRSSCYGGGGADGAALNNCLVVGNQALEWPVDPGAPGGGALNCALVNCTVVDNVAPSGGGTYGGSASNSIVYGNTATNGPNHASTAFFNSCTTPDPGGTGNVTNDPLFVDPGAGDFRLAAGSPCVDAGDNAGLAGAADLDGNPRIVNAFVDMGAYEYQAEGGTVLIATPVGTNVDFGAASELTLGVTANVAWTAETNVPWLAIASGDSGTTNGTVLFNVAANAGAARTGTIVVAGGGLARTCTVIQAAFVPALAISPASANAGSGGASGLALDVAANVAWTAATNVPWLAISSGASGEANGTVLFGVAANAGAARTGTIVVAGGGLARTCTVVQIKNPALAVSWHVATNGSDAAAGTSWATAKQTIQAAVDAAEAGDVVWVSNGVYDSGGRAWSAGLTNRVAINKPLAVQSVSGPDETILCGGVATRCAYVGSNAVLSGFTLTDGAVQNGSGGGVWCENSGVVSNCVLSGNSAGSCGGGAYGGTLRNCTLIGNSASWGGGAHDAALWACEISSNFVAIGGSGGGVDSCTANLCVISRNMASGSGGGGAFESTLNNCLVADNLALLGGGTCASTANSCTIVGNWAGSGFPDDGTGGGGCAGSTLINCIVYGNGATTGSNYLGSAFQHSCTAPDPGGTGNATSDPQFVDAAAGNYRLAAGSPCINAGDNAAAPGGTDLDGNPRVIFETADMGAYEFLYQHVAPGGSDGASGFSWATAKQTIQAAVDATTNGCIVRVSNGVYATGGRTVGPWALTNRVAIDRPITVQSVNGPEVTVILGPGTNSMERARCAYVGTNALLSGFTLTNGLPGGSSTNRIGGGAYIAGGMVEQCTISGNYAFFGAGVYIAGDGILSHCRVVGNSAGDSGGGGGVFGSGGGQIDNCLIAENYAEWAPGVYGRGGGMELVNCTISGNSSFGGPAVAAPTSTLWNCIVYSNNVDTDHQEIEGDPVVLHSCSPGLSGNGNVAADPQFIDAAAGNYRLQATSPCLDAGDAGVGAGGEDLDGNPRIAFGAVDMGAYEAQLVGEGTWFGAITNGRTNDLDCAAGDGVPNLLKYAMGGSPRVADNNVFVGGSRDGLRPILTFHRNPSATDVRFVVESAETMSSGAVWRGVATNVGGSWLGATNVEESGPGNPVECAVTDPVALGTNRFLRLRVSRP